MSSLILEGMDFISGIIPVDLQTAADNNGDWICVRNMRRFGVLFLKGAGTAGEDPTLTMEQATAVAGTSAKALNFTRIYTKQGAALTSVGVWTKVTQAAASTYTDLASAEVQAMWFAEWLAAELDVNNSFDCIRASIACTGATAGQIGTLLYVGELNTHQAPENMLSNIID